MYGYLTDRIFINLQTMKRLFLTLIGALLLSGSAMAQQWADQNYGVRVGFNVGNVEASDFSTDNKLGFQFGGFYEHKVSQTIPLYVEGALSISQKGFKCKMLGESIKSNMWYLEVPVTVNYKFQLDNEGMIYPSAGLFYALGIGGKTKSITKADTFDGAGFQRSDFGLRVGCTLDWKRYQLGISYSRGLLDIAKEPDMSEIKTSTFNISVGYRF